MKLLFIFVILFYFNSNAATPTEVWMTTDGVWVSDDPLCGSLQNVQPEGNPLTSNFLDSPVIASGASPVKTVNCVVMKMNSIVKFTGPNCSGDKWINVCGSGSNSDTPDGSSVSCTGTNGFSNTEISGTYVYLWLSTATSGQAGDSFLKPTSNPTTTEGFELTSAADFSGGKPQKFIVNFTDKLNAGCTDLSPPVFGFSGL